MLGGNVVDQFHDDDCFADPSATKKADLTASQIGFQQVYDLDSGFEHLQVSVLLLEGGSFTVDGISLRRLDGALFIDWLTNDIHNTAQGFSPDRHGNRATGVDRFHASHQSIGRLHGYGSHPPLA